ncbi:hypothetical protein [Actinoplanes sp. HUAS TT8]
MTENEPVAEPSPRPVIERPIDLQDEPGREKPGRVPHPEERPTDKPGH